MEFLSFGAGAVHASTLHWTDWLQGEIIGAFGAADNLAPQRKQDVDRRPGKSPAQPISFSCRFDEDRYSGPNLLLLALAVGEIILGNQLAALKGGFRLQITTGKVGGRLALRLISDVLDLLR